MEMISVAEDSQHSLVLRGVGRPLSRPPRDPPASSFIQAWHWLATAITVGDQAEFDAWFDAAVLYIVPHQLLLVAVP